MAIRFNPKKNRIVYRVSGFRPDDFFLSKCILSGDVLVFDVHDAVELLGGTGGGFDSVDAGGGTAKADHRHEEGHARPAGGAHVGFPQHRHQGACSNNC